MRHHVAVVFEPASRARRRDPTRALLDEADRLKAKILADEEITAADGKRLLLFSLLDQLTCNRASYRASAASKLEAILGVELAAPKPPSSPQELVGEDGLDTPF
jgi:hypothetical protein